MEKTEIAVGMSGGVDSSMSLLLLQRAGFTPVGVTLKLPRWENGSSRENAGVTEESIRVAKMVCDRLGVEHHVFDAREEFGRCVMDFFISELREGRTPNPCAECNRTLKFSKLFEFAAGRGIGRVATGHYAKSRVNPGSGEGELLRPRDASKDQTYGLCFLGGAKLAKTVFPLGDLLKSEVFSMAKAEGFDSFEKKKPSQDLCFVSAQDMPSFVESRLGTRPGQIVDSDGTVLGEHRGLHFYTVGQRKGLRLPGEYFVRGLDAGRNALVVTKRRQDLMSTQAALSRVHFISSAPLGNGCEIQAQVRYRQPAVPATLFHEGNGGYRVEFRRPVEAVTPGQVCAFFDRERCLGGGIIAR